MVVDQRQPVRLEPGELAELAASAPDWMLERDLISREFEFKDFRESMAFVESVAKLAEEHDHHPDIFISYNHVRLDLSTHTAGGLTEKDFALALAIDRLL
jgi:4a-hydroxytetrahydrobiopterin dehydratase